MGSIENAIKHAWMVKTGIQAKFIKQNEWETPDLFNRTVLPSHQDRHLIDCILYFKILLSMILQYIAQAIALSDYLRSSWKVLMDRHLMEYILEYCTD